MNETEVGNYRWYNPKVSKVGCGCNNGYDIIFSPPYSRKCMFCDGKGYTERTTFDYCYGECLSCGMPVYMDSDACLGGLVTERKINPLSHAIHGTHHSSKRCKEIKASYKEPGLMNARL